MSKKLHVLKNPLGKRVGHSPIVRMLFTTTNGDDKPSFERLVYLMRDSREEVTESWMCSQKT